MAAPFTTVSAGWGDVFLRSITMSLVFKVLIIKKDWSHHENKLIHNRPMGILFTMKEAYNDCVICIFNEMPVGLCTATVISVQNIQ